MLFSNVTHDTVVDKKRTRTKFVFSKQYETRAFVLNAILLRKNANTCAHNESITDLEANDKSQTNARFHFTLFCQLYPLRSVFLQPFS